jgi:hypothetical protein
MTMRQAISAAVPAIRLMLAHCAVISLAEIATNRAALACRMTILLISSVRTDGRVRFVPGAGGPLDNATSFAPAKVWDKRNSLALPNNNFAGQILSPTISKPGFVSDDAMISQSFCN